MITQIRRKLTVIVDYKTLLKHYTTKRVERFSFFLKTCYKLIIMGQWWYTWNLFSFRHPFKIDQSTIFIADMFYTITDASSIIFDLPRQLFC